MVVSSILGVCPGELVSLALNNPPLVSASLLFPDSALNLWRGGFLLKRKSKSQRGYTSAWDRARAGYLRSHPYCVHCQQLGRVVPSQEVDHIIPHRGDMKVFWDRSNWQALCNPCHSRKTQREVNARRYSKQYKIRGCDASGRPLDPNHYWNTCHD